MLKEFKIISLYSLMLLLVSCSGETKEEILNIEDITPQAKRDYSSDTLSKKTETVYPINDYLIDSLIGHFTISIYDKKMFPERFSPKWVNKLAFVNEKDTMLFCQWSFKDSVQTKNAFYNWIDCFGERCKSIRLGENTKFQRDNFVMLVNDTSINYISSPMKVSEKNWIKYFELDQKIENWKYIIYQRTGAKANWYRVEENELLELKTTKAI